MPKRRREERSFMVVKGRVGVINVNLCAGWPCLKLHVHQANAIIIHRPAVVHSRIA